MGHGDAVGVLAGAPVEIAPTAQALWMRGASLTMLHQPTPRTDLVVWAEDTTTVIDMIEAKAVVVSDPFMAAAPVLEERGIKVVTVEQLLAADPIDPIETDEDDLALMQLTSGSTGSPKAVQITHRNLFANLEAMCVGSEYNAETDVMISWLPLFHDMGMIGFLTVPMYFGARAGQGHPDGLPARHAAVGQADRQVPGHDDGRPELRVLAVRQAAAQAGQARPVRPVHAALRPVGR